MIWLISLQGMTRPWRFEINDLATNVVQTVGALSSTIRYRRIERFISKFGGSAFRNKERDFAMETFFG